uniref:Rho guanine nucleotide exchange factor 12 n=1 Tax=Lygus hesperus TaxID=30085 RepID=A0A0A9WPF3_LYGHE
MDLNSSGVHEKRLSNGPSFRRGPGRESSHHMTTLPTHCTTLTIYKDEKGYGMKVSGDNPVYVQSVKEGGAAEKAGLHSGDTILKVNGVNVTSLTHTEVVELIKGTTVETPNGPVRLVHISLPESADPNHQGAWFNIVQQ